MTEDQRQRFSAALHRVAGDESTLSMLAAILADDAPLLLSRLDAQVTELATTEVVQTAHALKGMLATFETGDPVSELQPLIDAARSNDLPSMTSQHATLRPKLEALLQEICAIDEN